MREMRQIRLWYPIAVSGLLLAAMASQGCSDDGNPSTTNGNPTSSSSGGGNGGAGGQGGEGGSGGSGGGTTVDVKPAANGAEFSTPFDATPDPSASTIYFTGLDANGEPGIFKVAADGSAKSAPIVVGDPLVAPLNIATSTDGGTLYIADTGAEDGTGDAGRIFSIANDGGPLTPLTAADAYKPRGLEIRQDGGKDAIYFAGTDPNGVAGVFKVPADGSGAVTAVATGAPFQDPSGIAVSVEGTVYACDTVQDDGLGSIISVTGSTATTLVTGIRAGYPCGVGLSADEKTLFVSSFDPITQTDAVARVDVAAKTVTYLSQGISQYVESAGLHRAKGSSDVFAWSDSKAQGTGTVFLVKIQ